MYWANFIHLYQPPTQDRAIVEKVTDECYRKIVAVLQECPNGRLTVNINGSLTEQLAQYGLNDVLDGLRKLAENGQIEFTGSAIYHPILPLIPENEARRQIRLNQEINRKHLGPVYQPRGFFPPEMCYSRRVAELVQEEGFDWIIVDELSYNGQLNQVLTNRTYTVKGLAEFEIYFKERKHSAALTYGSYKNIDSFLDGVGRAELGKASYLLTGTDGEIYGHHHPGLENLLREAFNHPDIQTCTISELAEKFPYQEPVETVAASWSTWEDELAEGIPYPQWKYPGHLLHDLQWQLTDLALKVFEQAGDDDPARYHLDQGLHSCQYWWGSCRQYFNVDMIAKGAFRLVDAIKAKGNPEEVKKGQQLAKEIKRTAENWEQTGHARKLVREYQEAHREVASELTFGGAK